MLNRFELESSLYNSGIRLVIGVDEAGRGPLAGPVVAAAVAFQRPVLATWWNHIADSKKVAEKKREHLVSEMLSQAMTGIGIATVEEIEQFNILQASLLAMKRAVLELVGDDQAGIHVIVDGKFSVPGLDVPQSVLVKADGLIHSVAAASLLAKVTRDNLMKQYDVEIPGYNFSQHKGYGTKAHIEAIRKLGLSPVHRLSFCDNIV